MKKLERGISNNRPFIRINILIQHKIWFAMHFQPIFVWDKQKLKISENINAVTYDKLITVKLHDLENALRRKEKKIRKK